MTNKKKSKNCNNETSLKNDSKKWSTTKVSFIKTGESSMTTEDLEKDDNVLMSYITAFGSDNLDIANVMTNHISRIVLKDRKFDKQEMDAAFAFVQEIKTKDPIEAMLAIQMLGTYLKSVHCLEKANLSSQTYEGETENINRATKLTRTFMAQMDALKKYRNKDGQKIKVEHVNINDGGKAVIGSTINNRINDDIK